jgi:ribonuclease P protein component
MRLRPEQRLRRQGEIRAVREEGERLDCRSFTVWYRRRDGAELTHARVGVVASRAAVGGAVQRNRAKRRLREIFRSSQHLLPADFDLLLVARSGVIRSPFAELSARFADACRRIGGGGTPA